MLEGGITHLNLPQQETYTCDLDNPEVNKYCYNLNCPHLTVNKYGKKLKLPEPNLNGL